MWWRDGCVGITSDVSLFDHFQVRPGAAAAVLRSRGELLLQCDQQHAVPHSTAVLPAGPCHAETAVQQRISCSEVCQSMCKIKSSDIKVQNDAHCHVHPLFCCCLHALMFKNTLFSHTVHGCLHLYSTFVWTLCFSACFIFETFIQFIKIVIRMGRKIRHLCITLQRYLPMLAC